MQLKWTNCIACICIGTTPEGYNLFPVLSSASSSTLSASILVTLNSILVLRIQPLPACIPKSGTYDVKCKMGGPFGTMKHLDELKTEQTMALTLLLGGWIHLRSIFPSFHILTFRS